MPIIEVSSIVKSERSDIYNLIRNIEAFPKFIKGVKRIEVIKRLPHRSIISWEASVDGAHITWKEEEIYDNVNYAIRFKMIEGDYNKYEGEWKLIQLLNCTKIVLSINVDWGAPALVMFPEVNKILIRKTKKALKSMLVAIKKKMEHSL